MARREARHEVGAGQKPPPAVQQPQQAGGRWPGYVPVTLTLGGWLAAALQVVQRPLRLQADGGVLAPCITKGNSKAKCPHTLYHTSYGGDTHVLYMLRSSRRQGIQPKKHHKHGPAAPRRQHPAQACPADPPRDSGEESRRGACRAASSGSASSWLRSGVARKRPPPYTREGLASAASSREGVRAPPRAAYSRGSRQCSSSGVADLGSGAWLQAGPSCLAVHARLRVQEKEVCSAGQCTAA
jgi:hypothetical protein